MEESAALARRLGLGLHTHLAETVEEDAYCRELYGCTPVEYLERVGWLDGRRLVRALHPPLAGRDRALRRPRRRRRPLPDLEPPARRRRRAGARAPRRAASNVGLGVDGSASNERSDLFFEVKQALLVARGRGGPGAMSAREALQLATRGGRARDRAERHRLARARQARRPRDLAHRRARARRRRRSRRRARPLRAAPGRPADRRRRRGRSRRRARSGADAAEIAREQRQSQAGARLLA